MMTPFNEIKYIILALSLTSAIKGDGNIIKLSQSEKNRRQQREENRKKQEETEKKKIEQKKATEEQFKSAGIKSNG